MKSKVLLPVVLISFCAFVHPAFTLDISSPAFNNGGFIPNKYTCTSYNFSPPLKWNNVPSGTESFALICDDPDAPFGTWVHWVIFNIPKDIRGLDENILKVSRLDNGITQGINSFGKFGYGGPCPPSGAAHHYFFKLYALDRNLKITGKITKKELISAMKGHILEKTHLIGLYRR